MVCSGNHYSGFHGGHHVWFTCALEQCLCTIFCLAFTQNHVTLMLSGFSAFSTMLFNFLTGKQGRQWRQGNFLWPLLCGVASGQLCPPRLFFFWGGGLRAGSILPQFAVVSLWIFLCLSTPFSVVPCKQALSLPVTVGCWCCLRGHSTSSWFSVTLWASSILNFIDSLGISSPVQLQGQGRVSGDMVEHISFLWIL